MRAIALVLALACCARACTDIQFDVTGTALVAGTFGDVAPIVTPSPIWLSCKPRIACGTGDDEEVFRQVQGLPNAYFRRGPKDWKGWGVLRSPFPGLPPTLQIPGIDYSWRAVLLLDSSFEGADFGLGEIGFTEDTAATVKWGKKGPGGVLRALKVFVSTKLYNPREPATISFPSDFRLARELQLVIGVQIDDSKCAATTTTVATTTPDPCAGTDCGNGTCTTTTTTTTATTTTTTTDDNVDGGDNEDYEDYEENSNGGGGDRQRRGVTCECAAGWNGAACKNDIDDCPGKDCGNGRCKDGVNTHTC